MHRLSFPGTSWGALAPGFFRVGACCIWHLAISFCLIRFSSALRSFAAFGLVVPWRGVLWGTLEVVDILSVGSWRRSLLCLALLRLQFLALRPSRRQSLCVATFWLYLLQLLPVGVCLCSCSSQLSFSFAANVCGGPGGVLTLGPLRVFIRFLQCSGSLWVSLSFVSPRSLLDCS